MAQLTVTCRQPDGTPVPASEMRTLYCTNLQRDPRPLLPRQVTDGRAVLDLPDEPSVLLMKLAVPGFGRVYQVADNGGRGYASEGEVDLLMEFARSRARAGDQTWRAARKAGCPEVQVVSQRLERAAAALQHARRADSDTERIARAYESLGESLWAGELAVFERARHEAAKLAPRRGFLFGCNAFGYPDHGEQYARLFSELLNFATLPFYWRGFEPEPGQKGFARVDRMAEWCAREGITAKGHPLTWFHNAGIPDWIKGRSFDEIRRLSEERIAEIVSRYAGRIDVWDVINEAHDWGNELKFSPEQLLDLTRMSAAATRRANPRATVIVNNCCLWGEYVSTGRTYFGDMGRDLRAPHEYLRTCLDARIDFDVVGLQVYYPGYDMLEIERMLERFAQLGKPIHITELGVSSKNEPDPTAHGREPSNSYWHAEWSERVQADWVEQFYTLCYGKPYIHAITWWDFADRGHFWPHGGFLRPDMTPKESYQRLKGLREKWERGGTA